MKLYHFNGHLSPTPSGMLPLQMSGEVYLAAEVRRELIKLASDLVCGKLLPEIDTEHWYVSTPQAERRRIVKAMDDTHERHKVLAMALKKLIDGSAKQHGDKRSSPSIGDQS